MPCSHSLALLVPLCTVLLFSATAEAQVDAPTLIDEVETNPRPSERRRVVDDVADDSSQGTSADPLDDVLNAPIPAPRRAKPESSKPPEPARPAAPVPSTPVPSTPVVPAKTPTPDAAATKKGAAATPAPGAPTRLTPPRTVLPSTTDSDLHQLWATWRKANAGVNRSEADAALKKVLAAKSELGIRNLDAFAIAAVRAADKRMEVEDPVGAIELAESAVQLAPGLPYARFALARAYFGSDPTDVGRWMAALLGTLQTMAQDPRYLRPAMGDLWSALLAALVTTAVFVVCILFARRSKYFLHDFHHLFPRAAARWQTTSLAVLLLALPVVFRLGLLPFLLVLFAATTLYLSWTERAVASVLIALVSFTPLFAKGITDATSFSGSVAERVYLLESGGTDARGAAEAVRSRMADGSVSYPELFALGRYELRRGRFDDASEAFKRAALEQGDDARLMVNLGNVRFGLGDLDGALALYTRATQADPALAAAFYNQSRVHLRKAFSQPEGASPRESDLAREALSEAQRLSPELSLRPEPDPVAQPLNTLLESPTLQWKDLQTLATVGDHSARVADQLSWRLMGLPSSPLAWLLPAVLAGLAVGLGGFSWTLSASRSCSRCGRSVCRRCDADLSVASAMCGQCVNVFSRNGVVAPQVKVRKMIEVDRYQLRTERLSWLFGIICSGAGHLFSGVTVKGVLFSFVFLFFVFVGVFREGVLRAPFGELPVGLRLVPAVLVLAVVYLLSLRSLKKVQPH